MKETDKPSPLPEQHVGGGGGSSAPFESWIAALDRLLGARFARAATACLFASAVACSIVLLESAWGERRRQTYLIFNLFLAWLPLLFAWTCVRLSEKGRDHTFGFWVSALCWLLFLPNAPYIFTDLVHLMGRSLPHYWPDMMKIVLFALTGFTVGMLSLEMMHQLVERRWGWWRGWFFAGGVSVLCAIGVYLGRFRRWNSWDALQDAKSIVRDAISLISSPWISSTTGQFAVRMAVVVFCGYVMVRMLRSGR
ncbi:MAG: DUF1361 domain-containing protein [Verrucomicrobia bacterium]|nr:DUF1361 domain-containing protein [Verrucomicrobiota bacterium]